MSPVRAILLNRIVIVLALAGVAVAGTLTYTHFNGEIVPCGGSSSCTTVLQHPSSMWGPIPVAALGLAAYLTILGIAIYRSMIGLTATKTAGLLAYGVGLIGAIVSIGLQVYAKLMIGEFCIWCITSAVIMTLLFMVQAALYQAVYGESVPQESSVAGPSSSRRGDFAVIGVAAVLSLGVMAFSSINAGPGTKGRMKLVDPEKVSKLVEDDAHYRGPENAPITIVEFGDLCCSACQKAFALLTNVEQQYEGKIRIVFRHFPLYQRHKESYRASVYAEFAAEKGKFWEFMTKAYQLPIEEVESATTWDNLLLAVNVDVGEAQRAYADENSPSFKRVYRDLTAANTLGVTVTPTFYVIAEGEKPYSIELSSLMHKLENDPKYRKLLGKGGG